jgi:hypothetical protein
VRRGERGLSRHVEHSRQRVDGVLTTEDPEDGGDCRLLGGIRARKRLDQPAHRRATRMGCLQRFLGRLAGPEPLVVARDQLGDRSGRHPHGALERIRQQRGQRRDGCGFAGPA